MSLYIHFWENKGGLLCGALDGAGELGNAASVP